MAMDIGAPPLSSGRASRSQRARACAVWPHADSMAAICPSIDLRTIDGNPATGAAVELAKGCYKFTRAQKEALALANLANSVESIVGMLPI